MGNVASKRRRQKRASVSAPSSFRMIPDQFTTLSQVSEALRRNGVGQCNLILGIDFTESNIWSGKRTFGRCLHDLNSYNPYKEVVTIIGKTLQGFDADDSIPCFGFGDRRTGDHSVFQFEIDSTGLPFERILERYMDIVPHVKMAGPTSFAPIVHKAIQIVKSTRAYHILVIIADGQITRSVDIPVGSVSKDEKETIDAIVLASSFPLSIITVGVGDGPWDAMLYFDNYLQARRFDNFQFVEYNKIMSRCSSQEERETQFALHALMEIPDQYRAIKQLGYLTGNATYSLLPTPMITTFPAPEASRRSAPSMISHEKLQKDVRPSAPDIDAVTNGVGSLSAVNIGDTSGANDMQRLQEKLLCCICEEREKNTVFQCGHECCDTCAAQLTECPQCRMKIQMRIKRYV